MNGFRGPHGTRTWHASHAGWGLRVAQRHPSGFWLHLRPLPCDISQMQKVQLLGANQTPGCSGRALPTASATAVAAGLTNTRPCVPPHPTPTDTHPRLFDTASGQPTHQRQLPAEDVVPEDGRC